MIRNLAFSGILILTGLALAAGNLAELRSAGNRLHSANVFSIQGSAYGKLLARLSETTIDRVWHLGVEQIVPHYMSGDPAHHGPVTTPAAPTDSSVADNGLKPTYVYTPVSKADLTPIERSKKWIQKRVIAQYTRTNPRALNDSHLATVYRDIEEMLLRSFKLDPTHYGTYDSYHLFLTTRDFGGGTGVSEHAEKIANLVISNIFKENEDPEPWLTAAAAASNLYQMASLPYIQRNEAIPLDILKEYQNKIGYCLARFDEVQAQAEKIGNWDRLSTERQMEIAERAHFAKRTFKQFEVMIARAESKSQSGKTEGEVAERSPEDKD